MRKFVALALIAVLSLTMALAVVGCGGQQEQSATPESSPMSEPMTEQPADTSAMGADTSSMQH